MEAKEIARLFNESLRRQNSGSLAEKARIAQQDVKDVIIVAVSRSTVFFTINNGH